MSVPVTTRQQTARGGQKSAGVSALDPAAPLPDRFLELRLAADSTGSICSFSVLQMSECDPE